MLSILIPSKTEKYLDNTILDILKNARGEIEVIAILDGYDTERIQDERVKYIILEPSSSNHKRQGVNEAVKQSKGDYVMVLDAHCMVAEGFDVQLIKDHQPNWVQVPRRHRLDAENWCLQPQGDTRPPIDYEYLMWQGILDHAFHGYKWDSRTLERQDILIDDILTMQGSTWFMTKEWYNKMGFMDIRYQGWGQEAEEISFTTWNNGGRVVVNKNTWYAHLHKGKKYGRMYKLNYDENKLSYAYAYNLWVMENKEFFIKLIEKFWPIPKWPINWKEIIWSEKN
jgi:glycosyltransferase involved in cell wall biosynthesis